MNVIGIMWGGFIMDMIVFEVIFFLIYYNFVFFVEICCCDLRFVFKVFSFFFLFMDSC